MSRIDNFMKKVKSDLTPKVWSKSGYNELGKGGNAKPKGVVPPTITRELKNTKDEFFTTPGKPKPRPDFVLHKKFTGKDKSLKI